MRIHGNFVEGGRIRVDKDTLDGASVLHKINGEWVKGKLKVRSSKESVSTNARFMGIEGTYANIIKVATTYVEIRLDIHVVGCSPTSNLPIYKGTSVSTLRLIRTSK